MNFLSVNKLICALAVLFGFSAVSGHAARAADGIPDVTNPIVVEAFVDGVVTPAMKRHHSPSGVVTVMKNGKIIFAKGYGYIDVDKRIPVDPDTSLFRPGSISKLFTWVSVMQLVEQGGLNLDVDVNQYLKDFQIEDSWPGQPVTLRHIMTHTAGFEDGFLGYLIIDDPERIMPLSQALARYQPVRVNPPGKHTAYSNWATALAGLIVSNVSGIAFNDYVQKNIFDVLGMKNSSFVEPLPPALDANMAKAYGYSAGKYVERNYEIISNFGPAGALAASAYDISLFARALLAGGEYDGRRILNPETLQSMIDEGFAHDGRVRGMGLGFIKHLFGPEGFDNFGHGGSTTIFKSHLGLSLQEDFMLFSSFSGPGAGQTHGALVKNFYDYFFPREVPVISPATDFIERGARYEGKYNSWRSNFTKFEALMRAFGGMEVTSMPDGTLMIGPKRYVEVGDNLFRETDGYGRIAFQENANGQVTGFVIDGTGVMQFYKAPFYETAGFTNLFVGLSFLVFISVFLRLAYQWAGYRSLQGAEKTPYRASIAVAAANLLFFALSAIVINGGMSPLMHEVPAMLKFSLIFPILATVAGFYHIYCTVQVWRQGLCSSIWARLRYSMISLCAAFMIWFYYYWNLLGFNYFS